MYNKLFSISYTVNFKCNFARLHEFPAYQFSSFIFWIVFQARLKLRQWWPVSLMAAHICPTIATNHGLLILLLMSLLGYKTKLNLSLTLDFEIKSA